MWHLSGTNEFVKRLVINACNQATAPAKLQRTNCKSPRVMAFKHKLRALRILKEAAVTRGNCIIYCGSAVTVTSEPHCENSEHICSVRMS